MTANEAQTRIAAIDAERKALYQRGGAYLGRNGQPISFKIPGTDKYARTNSEGWAYIKGRYAELMREREALAKAAAR